MDVRERNRLANQFKREADKHNIGSPFRIKLYIDARIAGKSEQKSLEIAKGK